MRRPGMGTRRRHLAALLTGSLIVGTGAPVFATEETATLKGTLLDPSGAPAAGLRVVVQDVATKKEYISSLSDDNGEYSLEVPAGARYRIIAAITPKGDRLEIRAATPMSVREPGTYRLPDVMFREEDREGAALPPEAGGPPAVKPWYERKSGVIGIVFGSIMIILLASDDGDRQVSPSSP